MFAYIPTSLLLAVAAGSKPHPSCGEPKVPQQVRLDDFVPQGADSEVPEQYDSVATPDEPGVIDIVRESSLLECTDSVRLV